jgi:hypothetical protein
MQTTSPRALPLWSQTVMRAAARGTAKTSKVPRMKNQKCPTAPCSPSFRGTRAAKRHGSQPSLSTPKVRANVCFHIRSIRMPMPPQARLQQVARASAAKRPLLHLRSQRTMQKKGKDSHLLARCVEHFLALTREDGSCATAAARRQRNPVANQPPYSPSPRLARRRPPAPSSRASPCLVQLPRAPHPRTRPCRPRPRNGRLHGASHQKAPFRYAALPPSSRSRAREQGACGFDPRPWPCHMRPRMPPPGKRRRVSAINWRDPCNFKCWRGAFALDAPYRYAEE